MTRKVRDARKKKLAKEIDVRQEELNKIFRDEQIEINKSVIGKYFKEYWDKSEGYTRFTYVSAIDEFGCLRGFYFDVFDNGVRFSTKGTYIQDGKELINNADEITLGDFEDVYFRQMKRIN